MTPSARLQKTLIDLSADPAKLAEFKRDPDAFLGNTDLDAEEREIIKSGDSKKITEAILPDVIDNIRTGGGSGTVFTLVISIVLD